MDKVILHEFLEGNVIATHSSITWDTELLFATTGTLPYGLRRLVAADDIREQPCHDTKKNTHAEEEKYEKVAFNAIRSLIRRKKSEN